MEESTISYDSLVHLFTDISRNLQRMSLEKQVELRQIKNYKKKLYELSLQQTAVTKDILLYYLNESVVFSITQELLLGNQGTSEDVVNKHEISQSTFRRELALLNEYSSPFGLYTSLRKQVEIEGNEWAIHLLAGSFSPKLLDSANETNFYEQLTLVENAQADNDGML